MRIIVTGAAGFIGSNLVRALNEQGHDDVIAVDNLTRADKFSNLVNCRISDYLDKTDFLDRFARGQFGKVRAVFHQGACSDTMEPDGRYIMENNFRFSKALIESCLAQGAQFLYASSAAAYGERPGYRDRGEPEQPLNIYAYSKFLFDQIVRRMLPGAQSQIVGLRYFNVYGRHESHKGRMASVAFHSFNQFRTDGTVKLYGEYGGYGPGCHSHDFVSVEDVIKVNLFFFEHRDKSGIYDVGTGRTQPFNDIAATVINTLRVEDGKPALPLDELVQEGLLEYIKFPDALRGKYQCFTQSDVSRLREAGYKEPFVQPDEGVARYCHWLLQQGA